MAAPPLVSWRDAVRVFEKQGWRFDRTRGSHYIMVKEGVGLISIPMKNPISRGTLRSVIYQAGMTVEQFIALL